jgi:5-(carboxyamino)imidazole ribonucleotide synthase
MFARAAQQLGYRVVVWDQDRAAPALRLADVKVTAPFEEAAAVEAFCGQVSAVTYEWENIPVELVCAVEQRVPVRPSSLVLEIIQDRIAQKIWLEAHGFPVPAFDVVESAAQFRGPSTVGFPCLCKTARSGYDGKGQWKLVNKEEVPRVQAEMVGARGTDRHSPPMRFVLEQFLNFQKELSCLVVRDARGRCCTYPVSENTHEHGILRTSMVPALIDPGLEARVRALSTEAVAALDGVGVFCVEWFLLPDGTVLINEIAPRPHNSGHYTLDACLVSQFEQQVRTLCGLPLGEPRLLCPAVMVNLIGEEFTRATTGALYAHLLSTPGAVLHIYGKTVVRPGRKMGHVTFLADTPEEARTRALAFRQALTQT